MTEDDEAERRYNVIAEARETLARVAHVTVERRDHAGEYWSRPEPKPEPVQQRQTLTDAEEAQRWERFIDGKIWLRSLLMMNFGAKFMAR